MSRLPDVANPHRKLYPSDLSDAEWAILRPLLPTPKQIGHPVEVDFREILNGVFYVQRTGCQWEMLPHDLPPHSTVYLYFQKWRRKGVWHAIHDAVREQLRLIAPMEADSPSNLSQSQVRIALQAVARRLKGISEMFS